MAGIDGSIQEDRESHAEKINEQAGGAALPGGAGLPQNTVRSGNQENETPSTVGGTSPHAIPNVNHPERKSSDTPTPPLPPVQAAINSQDIPDAKDDDVVARQLREAALAEEDPVLREKLWDELRRYLAKRK